MVRHSLKYVPHKEKKEVAKDLKSIYSAINEKHAKENLEYPYYIRKAIYTTNAIESANYSLRKIIKK